MVAEVPLECIWGSMVRYPVVFCNPFHIRDAWFTSPPGSELVLPTEALSTIGDFHPGSDGFQTCFELIEGPRINYERRVQLEVLAHRRPSRVTNWHHVIIHGPARR